jgi:hypothetical protein
MYLSSTDLGILNGRCDANDRSANTLALNECIRYLDCRAEPLGLVVFREWVVQEQGRLSGYRFILELQESRDDALFLPSLDT